MEVIPVIDIKDGKAVSGKSGKRDDYKPLKSIFCPIPNPIKISEALSEYFNRIYIADLNAIMGRGNNFDIIKDIKMKKIVDFGIRRREDFNICKKFLKENDKIILATETLKDLSLLKENVFVSLDFKDNKLLNYDLDFIISLINEKTPLIILDISSVGTKRGINKELINMVMRKVNNPIYVGGGVRNKEDLKVCVDLGIDGVLVGTALHSGELKLDELLI
ncbi:hisA/hisF family protein [Methanocaldococcus villosus KIN24-T80]|uniref:HisA/hisF family protein n=1 Tax=Methanocaldococcus villosus KIN24-T80 TaxID=1069083 RepID=N6UUS6_9EURY|nr:HisA/HisF family protein [Methanocaldococcus villosus]ENN96089.1 hisA/hisF family protein [Methanocaldococcus villosus KIN24-T80]